jgi:hypothetical protein
MANAPFALPEIVANIANDPNRKVAWDFFVFFSRLEYALKRVDEFLMPNDGDAKPNWDRFGAQLNVQFPANEPEVAAAIAFYCAEPPRRQIRIAGGLGWSAPEARVGNEPVLIWLFRAIRVVRNNLFHGGKFPHFVFTDPSRNGQLLLHAIVILAAALPIDVRVRDMFVEAINE